MGYYGYGEWRPYVPVAKRLAQAAKYASSVAKKEKRALCPVKIEGRSIARSFWGQAWCENLERYSDFANRLPRGRTYARNGSVVDLQIQPGTIKAIVGGSEIYNVSISIKTLPGAAWKGIKQDCSRSITSLMDLLQGRFDTGIMARLTDRTTGLFPQPKEIEMKCSCPDWATLCKHVAAVLYGVAARLDLAPELLFTLRDVDHQELVTQALAAENLQQTLGSGDANSLAGSDLGELFGIDLAHDSGESAEPASRKRPAVPRSQAQTPAKGAKKKPRQSARKAAKSATVPSKELRKTPAKKSAGKPTDDVVSKRKRAAASAPGKRKTPSLAR